MAVKYRVGLNQKCCSRMKCGNFWFVGPNTLKCGAICLSKYIAIILPDLILPSHCCYYYTDIKVAKD